jgi:3'5'-cyclic nucleotide phosphodiesterase
VRDVHYHNDLHGIDVGHMAYLFLTEGRLTSLLALDHVDTISLLTAAICHDLGHDGFTNIYHVNALTDRAIRYNDVSV